MGSDVDKGLFQCFDETQCSLLSVLAQVVLDRLIDIPVGELTRDDGLGFHPRARPRPRLRSASKWAAWAGAAGGGAPPSSSRPRRCSRSASLRINSRTYSLLVP